MEQLDRIVLGDRPVTYHPVILVDREPIEIPR